MKMSNTKYNKTKDVDDTTEDNTKFATWKKTMAKITHDKPALKRGKRRLTRQEQVSRNQIGNDKQR